MERRSYTQHEHYNIIQIRGSKVDYRHEANIACSRLKYCYIMKSFQANHK